MTIRKKENFIKLNKINSTIFLFILLINISYLFILQVECQNVNERAEKPRFFKVPIREIPPPRKQQQTSIKKNGQITVSSALYGDISTSFFVPMQVCFFN